MDVLQLSTARLKCGLCMSLELYQTSVLRDDIVPALYTTRIKVASVRKRERPCSKIRVETIGVGDTNLWNEIFESVHDMGTCPDVR